MKEASLVAFTLLTQAAVGACWAALALQLRAERAGVPDGAAGAILLVAFLAALAGLAASFLHLGRPSNAWRALRNLRASWLSREILFASAFTAALGASALLPLLGLASPFLRGFAEGLAAVFGLALLYAMTMAYRLRTVPAWDRATTNAAFLASTLGLGALAAAAVLAAGGGVQALPGFSVARLVVVALAFHLLGLAVALAWLRGLAAGNRTERESLARVAAQPLLFRARVLLSALAVAAGVAAQVAPGRAEPPIAACLLAFAAEAAARALFYEARVREGL